MYERLHILVADDLVGGRKLLREILLSFGVRRISEAGSGEEALTRIAEGAPDILFTDWDMRPVDGIELMRRIRSGETAASAFLPIIMVTAHTAVERVHAARDAGATEVLAKPITVRSLLSRIEEVIERPRPFVRAPSFFGPDRRRRNDAHYMGPRRRAADRRPPRPSGDVVEL